MQALQKLVEIIVNPIIKLAFAAALLYFLWGVVEFIKNSDSESDREKGKLHMLWGVIGMAIMVGVNGIIGIIQGTIDSLAK